jgi:hypothetical protein
VVWRRLRWLALAAAARLVVRVATARQVDRAAAELGERLPAPVRSALDALPRDPVRAGGGLVVAGRGARRLATGAGRATRLVDRGRRRVAATVASRPRLGAIGRAVGDDLRREREQRRRELRSAYLRATVGDTEADDALLDRRDLSLDQRHRPPNEPLDPAEGPPGKPLPDPIGPGRWRASRLVPTPTVARVKRTYRPPAHPWDR